MSLGSEQILETLQKVGAVIKDSHLVYTSGKHGNAYVNKDALYPHTQVTSTLCWSMAEPFQDDAVDVVLAPAVGGVILSQWIAHHMTELNQREVLGVYAEKDTESDGFVIKRGYDDLIRGKRVLVVEDILTTGGSVKKVVEAVRKHQGNIVGVSALCNRGGITAKDLGDVPKLHSLISVQLESWEEKDCPLCRQQVPINTQVGKGKEYLAKKRNA